MCPEVLRGQFSALSGILLWRSYTFQTSVRWIEKWNDTNLRCRGTAVNSVWQICGIKINYLHRNLYQEDHWIAETGLLQPYWLLRRVQLMSFWWALKIKPYLYEMLILVCIAILSGRELASFNQSDLGLMLRQFNYSFIATKFLLHGNTFFCQSTSNGITCFNLNVSWTITFSCIKSLTFIHRLANFWVSWKRFALYRVLQDWRTFCLLPSLVGPLRFTTWM